MTRKAHIVPFLLLTQLGSLVAAPIFTNSVSGPNSPSTTTDETTYSADVSAADLLHGIQGAGGSWNSSGSSPNGLNDGLNGEDFDAAGNPAALSNAAWAQDGDRVSFREFLLGNGANGVGFDIQSIQSIAAWQSAGFSNQRYEVRVRRVGETGFPTTPLLTVNYQPFSDESSGGSTKVRITDSTGVLASRVVAIRFDILDTVSNDGGGVVMREIDVFGIPSIDTTPPAIATLAPANNATNFNPAANLTATFTEGILLSTGSITIRNIDTSSEQVITLPDSRVTASGTVLTIDPASHLAGSTRYAIRISAGAVTDASGNPFVGIANNTTWTFVTGIPDIIPPSLLALNPLNNATGISTATDLAATFNEPISRGTGSITLRNLNTNTQSVIPVSDPAISISGAVLRFNPAANLLPLTKYSIRMSSDAILDIAGNPFVGIANDTTWTFTTSTSPLRIMCMGDSITAGYTDNPSWADHPFKFGYRSFLYTLLTNAGYSIQYVGGSPEPWSGIFGDPTNGGTYKPAFDLRDIGQDFHRGYGGQPVSFMNSNILSWLAADTPDIILIKIGTSGHDKTGMNNLVNTITTQAPNAHLIIAQIMPTFNYDAVTVDYNNWLRTTLVPNNIALGRKVSMVDQYAPFLTNPNDLTSIDQSLFSNGINHPDNDGYEKMAQVWFTAIQGIIKPSVISVSPPMGSTAGGTAVTITGSHFNGATSVAFNGVPASNVMVVNSTTITATTPAGSSGVANVRVTTAGGISPTNTLFTYNNPPTFSGYQIATAYETAATISLSKLLTASADDDGDTRTVTSVNPASAQGGTVNLQSGSILYTPATGFAGNDSFALTITDARGATVSGVVSIAVGANPNSGGPGTNAPQLNLLPSGHMGILFRGIPGRSYQIQRSTNLTSWTSIATVVAASDGAITYTDPLPPTGSAFYRLLIP